MAETQTGIAIVWGAGNLTGTQSAIVIGPTTGLQQSNDFTWDSDKAELRDGLNDVVGMASYNANKAITMTVIPSNATVRATAITNMNNAMFPAGTAVDIVDADGVVIDGLHSGNYHVESSSLNRTNNGPATWTLTLRQFVANDVSVTTS